jgi:hypothetical protein
MVVRKNLQIKLWDSYLGGKKFLPQKIEALLTPIVITYIQTFFLKDAAIPFVL